MEETEVQSTEVAVDEAPQAPVTEQAAPQEATGTVEATTEAPQYVPDFKYKVKNEEFEFDEWAKPFIKDKSVEDNFRNLYSQVKAFETVKEARDRIQSQFEDVNGNYSEIMNSIDVLRDHVRVNDFESFFKDLGIPIERVQQWMYQHLQAGSLPPEQRNQYVQSLNATREANQLRRENLELTTRQEEMQVQAREAELDRVLQDPQVNELMQSFDRKIGRVGAFRNEVVNYAAGRSYTTGEDLTAQDAVNAIVAIMGGHGAAAQAQPQVVAPQSKPVIPNITGNNASPVRKAPKSIDEMRQFAKEKYGEY